jgi:hypothetical protein
MKKTFLMAALLLTASAGSFAQTLDEVLAKHVAAIGGMDKIKAVKTAEYEQLMIVPGAELEAKWTIIVGQAMRSDVSVMGQIITTAVNGDKGWMINPMAGSSDVVDIPAEQIKMSKSQTELPGLQLALAKENGATLTLVGKEKVGDRDLLHITAVNGESTVDYFLDPADYTIQTTKAKISAMGQTMDIAVEFSDYKKEGDLLLPHKSAMNMMGQDITTKLTKIIFNPTVDQTIFDKPAK